MDSRPLRRIVSERSSINVCVSQLAASSLSYDMLVDSRIIEV